MSASYKSPMSETSAPRPPLVKPKLIIEPACARQTIKQVVARVLADVGVAVMPADWRKDAAPLLRAGVHRAISEKYVIGTVLPLVVGGRVDRRPGAAAE